MSTKEFLQVFLIGFLVASVLGGIYFFIRIRPRMILPQQVHIRKRELSGRQMGLMEIKLKWDEVGAKDKMLEEVQVLMKEERESVEVSCVIFNGRPSVFSEFDAKVIKMFEEEGVLLNKGMELFVDRGGVGEEELKVISLEFEEIITLNDSFIEKLDSGLELFQHDF